MWFFVLLIIVFAASQLYLNARQARAVSAGAAAVPPAFAAHITLAAHQKAAAYTLAKLRYGNIALLIEIALLLGWTLYGGINALQSVIASLGLQGLAADLALFAGFGFIAALIDLPLSWARTFKLETEFGFNKTDTKTFWLDWLKGLVLSAVIGLPLLALVIWMMGALGAHWWLWAGCALVGFNLILLWLYPTLIAPLFNKFTPLSDAALAERIQQLAQRSGFQTKGIMVMDGSRRSGHGNAYFTGLGKNKRVVFFDTLLSTLSPAQTLAVLAHELGHFKHNHVKLRMAWVFASLFGLLACLAWLAPQTGFYQMMGLDPLKVTPGVTLLAFMLFVPLVLFFFSPLGNWLSRKHEFEADAYAAAQTNSGDLITALVALYRDNASSLTPDALYSFVHNSHPPASIRIAALERGAA